MSNIILNLLLTYAIKRDIKGQNKGLNKVAQHIENTGIERAKKS